MRDRILTVRKWLFELVRRFRPPRRIFPTRAGWVAFFAPFVLGMAAINAGNNLLFLLLGACLGAIVISGIMSERALRGIKVGVQLLGNARAGQNSRFGIQIERRLFEPGDNPSFGLVVREERGWTDRLSHSNLLKAVFPRIEEKYETVVASRTFSSRGLKHLNPLELSTIYPFGLLTKSKSLQFEHRVIVWPPAVDVPDILAAPAGKSKKAGRTQLQGQGDDLYGLREKTEFDAPNRVHAKRSQALGREVVVEREKQERPQAWLGVLLVAKARHAANERVLEVACETILHWAKSGYRVGLYIGNKRFSPAVYQTEQLLDEIALLNPNTFSYSLDNLANDALWLIPVEGPVLPEEYDACVVSAQGAVSSC